MPKGARFCRKNSFIKKLARATHSPLKTVVLQPAAAREPAVTLPPLPAARISSQKESNAVVAVVVDETAVEALESTRSVGDASALCVVVVVAEKREGSRQSGSSLPAAVLHSLSSCFFSFLQKDGRRVEYSVNCWRFIGSLLSSST